MFFNTKKNNDLQFDVLRLFKKMDAVRSAIISSISKIDIPKKANSAHSLNFSQANSCFSAEKCTFVIRFCA